MEYDIENIIERILELENDIRMDKNVKEAQQEIEYILASLPPLYLLEIVARLDNYFDVN